MAKVFQVDTGGTLTTELRAYWKLDDTGSTVVDFFSTNNGTITGASSVAGKINNALDFGGVNTYKVAVPDSANFDVTNGWSVNYWINFTEFVAQDTSISKWNSQGGDGANEFIWYPAATNGGTLYARNTSDTQVSVNGPTMTLVTGTWYMFTGTFDGSYLRFYINGTVGTPAALDGNMKQGTENLWIGDGSANPNDTFTLTGKMDEVGYWGKTLTQTEIADLYNSGAGQTMIETQDYSMTASVGAFVLTGIAALLIRGYTIVCAVGSFILTGIDAGFKKALKMIASVEVLS